MGRLAAVGMIEQAGVDTALAWHMKANLFPPPPPMMIAIARTAIDHANSGDLDAEIDLPEGVLYRGNPTMAAWQAVAAFHLESFLIESEDEL